MNEQITFDSFTCEHDYTRAGNGKSYPRSFFKKQMKNLLLVQKKNVNILREFVLQKREKMKMAGGIVYIANLTGVNLH